MKRRKLSNLQKIATTQKRGGDDNDSNMEGRTFAQNYAKADQKERFDQRKSLSRFIKWLTAIWVGFVCLIVLVQAVFHSPICGYQFGLSDNVMMTLLGTTTLDVIGLFKVVLSGMFPSK